MPEPAASEPQPPAGHTLNTDGECLERCEHLEHRAAPINVTFHAALETPLRQWLSDLSMEMAYFPTSPEDSAGIRSYVVAPSPDHPAFRSGPLDGKVRR